MGHVSNGLCTGITSSELNDYGNRASITPRYELQLDVQRYSTVHRAVYVMPESLLLDGEHGLVEVRRSEAHDTRYDVAAVEAEFARAVERLPGDDELAAANEGLDSREVIGPGSGSCMGHER